ncbi:MAG: FAD-dependent monooxygenase [Luteimonas sp.]|nr:FAD-dependent monooxygenase [Luteimonas sp.]
MQPRHVAIVGYGTAGQAAAVLLSRDGHRVEVFEQAPQPGPVGAGFLLQPTGLQVLWSMGLLDAVLAHGAPVRRLYGETPRMRPVMDMRYSGLDARLCGLGLQRGALFSLLAQAWPGFDSMHRDTRITAIDDGARRIRDADDRWHGPFDMIVVADGSASCLRGQVTTGGLDRPYPWGALWCLVPRGDWPWQDELRQRYVAARRMIGLLPVGTRPGDDTPRLSFFWSLRGDDFDGWRERGMQAWIDEVRAIWPEALDRLGEVGEASLARASYRDAVPRQWHRDRVVLVGDAAHAMSPQLGQGVNMALMDALALRDAMRAHDRIDPALAAYERERRGHVCIYQFWSRWLTPLFQSERDLVAKLRDVAFLPLGRVPGGRGHMLRVLSGTQHGMFGKLGLHPDFIHALGETGHA